VDSVDDGPMSDERPSSYGFPGCRRGDISKKKMTPTVMEVDACHTGLVAFGEHRVHSHQSESRRGRARSQPAGHTPSRHQVDAVMQR
jgi:hypothetical protein